MVLLREEKIRQITCGRIFSKNYASARIQQAWLSQVILLKFVTIMHHCMWDCHENSNAAEKESIPLYLAFKKTTCTVEFA